MSDTPMTDASISWHTAYSGYGNDRISFKAEHVEVNDCRNIERELREEIAAARAEVERLREALQDACLTYAVHGDQPPQKWLDALAAKETK